MRAPQWRGATLARESSRRWRGVAVVAGILALASHVRAAEPETASAAAASPSPPSAFESSDALRRAQRSLLERAKQRYEAGRGAGEEARPHLEAALDALELAYRLRPEPWLLFNLAQVQSQLGGCSEAAQLYRRYLASDPVPEARQSAEKALELLQGCDDSGPVLRVQDGLPPGLHIPSSLDSIFLGQGLAAAREPPPPLDAEPESDGLARVLPWAFGSLSVISAAAGGLYWSEALAAKRDLDRIVLAGPHVARTQQRGESAQDLARVFGGLAVGFALAAGASYLWLRTDPAEAPFAATLERLSWFPLSGGAGASYRSEF